MIAARAKRVGMGAYAKGNAGAVRGRDRADHQDPATRRGATIGWYRRFRESDGGLFAVLLAAYLFVTAIPAAVVMMGYVYNDPTELADRLAGRLDLTGGVKTMLDSVLAGASWHQLVATLIAVFDVLKYYGSLGIVMALFFWIMIYAGPSNPGKTALAPALAHRRDLREARAHQAVPA